MSCHEDNSLCLAPVMQVADMASHSTASPPTAPPRAPARKRQRKWHARVFTGCANCRRRHVRCDEQMPSCANCSRLSLACDYDGDNRCGRFLFRAVCPRKHPGPPVGQSSLSPAEEFQSLERAQTSVSQASLVNTSGDQSSNGRGSPVSASAEDTTISNPQGEGEADPKAISDDLLMLDGFPDIYIPPSPPPSSFFAIPSRRAPDIVLREAIYYNHFLTDVSTILIIYDTPSNANPYRILPRLAGRSNLLQDTMVAFGAMHLANLPTMQDKAVHYRAAMEIYVSVITRLSGILSDNPPCFELESLATSLLLCMFEKMYATDGTWKVHLGGARRILEAVYSPRPFALTERGENYGVGGLDGHLVRPMRRFLVSLMAYLDVAAACATGEGTLIPGDYWETLGGGWEYNLGAPSFHPSRTLADRALAQIRISWSRIMSIQAGISAFAKLRASDSLDDLRSNMVRDNLAHRIANWHDCTPDVYMRLSVQPDEHNAHPNVSKSDAELLAAAACVECYAMACSIYLDRVVTQKLGRAAHDPTIATAVNRILTLTSSFADGLGRLAHLWSLFTAGTAITDEGQKVIVREFLLAMKNFGFKVGEKAGNLVVPRYLPISYLLTIEAYSMFLEPWTCWSTSGYSIDCSARRTTTHFRS